MDEKRFPKTDSPIEETRINAATPDVEEVDEYEGYSRSNPPPWLDEFEYIDFMMTH